MSISDYVKKGAESAKEIAETLVEKSGEAFEEIKDKAEELKEKAEDALQRTPCLDRATDMYGMISEGQVSEAFEKYYHDDVVMQEPTGEPRRGKVANREFMKQWMANVDEHHGGGVTAIASNEEEHITIVETWTDATYNGKRMKMEEVAVQRWEGDKIIHERFYYTMPE